MSKKYTVSKGFIIQKIGNKSTLFDPESSVMYTLNETASYIFEKVKRGMAEKEIAGALMKKYDVSEQKAARDTKTLMKSLKRRGIIS